MTTGKSINNKDINNKLDELKEQCEITKKIYEECTSLYSLKGDLREISDKRYSLARRLDQRLATFKNEKNKILKEIQQELEQFKVNREHLISFLKEKESLESQIDTLVNHINQVDTEGNRLYDILVNVTSEDTVKELEDSKNRIETLDSELFSANEDGEGIYIKTKNACKELNDLYDEFIGEKEEGNSKAENLKEYYREIERSYKKCVEGYEKIDDEGEQVYVKSYLDAIRETRDDLQSFHERVFGKEQSSGLKDEIENRLISLKEVEAEAKRVIDLSSDAGLAGGFCERGKAAKKNRNWSLLVFVGALILLTLVNLFSIQNVGFGIKSLSELLEPQLLLTKVFISLPIIWIAIVANVNLNKYSRLEEEYAHKESLAKSFERYKKQVLQIEDQNNSKDLMAKLLEANILAFKKNAAMTMDKAKPDSWLNYFSNRKGKEPEQ